VVAVLAAAAPWRPAAAQEADAASIPIAAALEARATLPLDSVVVTQGSATIGGETVPYTATTGTLPVYDERGMPEAAVFFVYYRRADVQDATRRPLFISFNGGPGSSSVWMHLGYTGPRRVMIDDEGNPVQPYGLQDNPHSILDVADIVFVDPVNVGLSRPVEGTEAARFFGVNPDIEYLGRWIRTFVDRMDRWASPKYLIGESYGTTRVAGLSHELQTAQKIFLNGVVLVSPTGLGIDRDGPVGDALALPHYTATAWYHGALEPELQERDLDDLLPEVERFTVETYIPSLVQGGFLEARERERIAGEVGRWAGVSSDFVDDLNLVIPISTWRKELLRDQGLTVGRLDARYQGVDRMAAGMSYDYDPAMAAWNHAFTPAMNLVLHELGWETDLTYITIGGPVRPWIRQGDTTGEDLRQAMAENPYLKTLIQAGVYDGGTDYFSAKYTMWHLDPSGRLRDKMRFETYRSGHMMYLRDEDLATSNQHIREFIEWSTPEPGEPALWGRRTPANSGG
jgi:carboxypeptidase C (cathepsin A)